MLPDRENMTRHDQQICDVIDLVPNTVCDTDVLLAIVEALDKLLDCRKNQTSQKSKDIAQSIGKISTEVLVDELRTREGVETTMANPYEDRTITVNGPATILVIID